MNARLRACIVLVSLTLATTCAPILAQSTDAKDAAAPSEKMLWRARTRLERGDIFLSQPLYERLYKELRDEGGPLLSEVAQGLAICEIARAQAPAAVGPWLDALRLRSGAPVVAISDRIPALMDEQTGLAPLLAPIWLAGPELAPLVDEQFERRYLSPESGEPEDIAALALLYRRSARFELGLPIESPDASSATVASGDEQPSTNGTLSAPIALVRMIVDARIGDNPTRDSARERIHVSLAAELEANPGSWREAWLRAGLGRSLLRESDPNLRESGMIELMHLPARFAESQPRLAAIALAEVSRELANQGRQPASEAVAALIQGPLADPDALRWLQDPGRPRDHAQPSPPPPASPAKEAQGS